MNQTLKKECDFILDEEMMADGEIKIRKLKEGKAAELNDSAEEINSDKLLR